MRRTHKKSELMLVRRATASV